jgi:HEAT repeat protein
MPNAIPALIAALSLSDPSHRAKAAEQLAQAGTDAQAAAVPLVLACGDEAEEVRTWATSALEELGPPDAADVGMLTSLVEAQSPDVAYWAATLLGRLKDAAASAVNALSVAVERSSHLAVRQRATWALGEIGTAAVAALPFLHRAASNADPRLARLAIEAIQKVECPG